MARVYMITEEEMHSLIDSLELESLRADNTAFNDKHQPINIKDAHRTFHYKVVQWAQAMGFKTGGR